MYTHVYVSLLAECNEIDVCSIYNNYNLCYMLHACTFLILQVCTHLHTNSNNICPSKFCIAFPSLWGTCMRRSAVCSHLLRTNSIECVNKRTKQQTKKWQHALQEMASDAMVRVISRSHTPAPTPKPLNYSLMKAAESCRRVWTQKVSLASVNFPRVSPYPYAFCYYAIVKGT